jgi:hypothetical protein
MTIHFGFRSITLLFVLTFSGISLAEEPYAPATTVPPGCAVALKNIRLAKEYVKQNPSSPQFLVANIKSVTSGDNFVDCFAQILIPTDRPRTNMASLIQAAKQSSNKQAGSTNGTAGTTNAVSQPFSLLSLASEYGGLTTSTNNGTFTFQAALDQIPSALATDHLINVCRSGAGQERCIKERDLEFLHRFSLGATFNTSTSSKTVNATATGSLQGNTQQVSLTPHGSESPSLSTVTAKVVLWNEKADAEGPWAKAVTSSTYVTASAQDLLAKIKDLPDLARNHDYAVWQICTSRALASASDAELDKVFLLHFNQLHDILILGHPFVCDRDDEEIQAAVAKTTPTAQQLKEFTEKLKAVRDSLDAYYNDVTKLQNSVNNPVLTFEYDWNQPQNQPTNSVFKLVFSKNVLDHAKKNTVWTFTGNFAASIYNAEPASTIPGASHLRDIQAGVEADWMLPSIPLLKQTTLSGAYYFQDQTSPSILNVTPGTPITGITFTGLPSNAAQVFTQKGDIHLAQIKWALGTGKNVHFPFAFSYSNRTELIQKPDWRGQFGVSYDFSSLLSGQNGTSK